MNKLLWAGSSVAIALLAGCGGGGGGGTSTPVPTPIAKAEGVYQGPATNGTVTGTIGAVILEDDSIWGLSTVAGVPGIAGLFVGSGASNNGSYSATVKGYTPTVSGIDGTLSATYSPGISMAGTFSTGTSFNGTTTFPSGYIYNTPALLSSLVGRWTGTSMVGNLLSISITSTGNYSGTSGTCAFSGTMTPRPSGKNIFNVTYANGATGCPIPNLAAQGIAAVSSTGLLMMFTTADKAIGAAVILTK